MTFKSVWEPGWGEIDSAVHSIARRIREQYMPFDVVVGIRRGGVIPATMLAYALGITHVESVTVQTRHGPDYFDFKQISGLGNLNLLFVDDIVDSGKTFSLIQERYKDKTYVALYTMPGHKARVDEEYDELDGSQWIAFPWEMEADICHASGWRRHKRHDIPIIVGGARFKEMPGHKANICTGRRIVIGDIETQSSWKGYHQTPK